MRKLWIACTMAAFLIVGIICFVWYFYLPDPTGARLFSIRKVEKEIATPSGGRLRQLSYLMGTDRVGWRPRSREVDLGFCIHRPVSKSQWGDSQQDFSRLATSYFHRRGPVGRVMERWNWFPGADNTFAADARLPASLVAAINPVPMLASLWSEPPVAVIGLECGTMASYARPFQQFHFFEKYPVVRDFSFPPAGKEAVFTFVPDALSRGASMRIATGEPRAMMEKEYAEGGPGESFYHAIVITGFYTQEIPTNLLTREALQVYFRKLTPTGIVCIGTSNRYYDVIKALAPTVESVRLPDLKNPDELVPLVCYRGHDLAPQNRNSPAAPGVVHYTSEWLMIARASAILDSLTPPQDYEAQLEESGRGGEAYWESPVTFLAEPWTDAKGDISAVRRRE